MVYPLRLAPLKEALGNFVATFVNLKPNGRYQRASSRNLSKELPLAR